MSEKKFKTPIGDGELITTVAATAAGIFFGLRTEAPQRHPPKASLDAMDIMKLAGGICRGVLVKDYAVYKKWIS